MPFEVVYDAIQLAAAVDNMDIDTIYLGADIEMNAPITIPANRESLTFDGTYDNITHMLTDMNSNSFDDTLAVTLSSSIYLTFQNMNMTGRNYYGIPCIYDVFNSGVTVKYDNITYTGPQLVHNLSGITIFKDVDITIEASAVSEAQEVGGVSRVVFEGNNILRHRNIANLTRAVFWFNHSPGSLVVTEGAKLEVDTSNYFMYNALVPVAYEIQRGASFTLNANRGIMNETLHRASSFLVDEGASFRYTQEAPNASVASLYLSGSFVVNQGASVFMQADFDGAQPLLMLPLSSEPFLRLNRPKSFVLYNRGNDTAGVEILVLRSYSIETEQLNHWETVGDGTFDDVPLNYWHNADWHNFTVSGNLSLSTTTATAVNLDNPPISINNFRFQSSRVISAGEIYVTIDPVVDNGRPFTGLTEPDANIKISYTVEGVPYTFELSAEDDGSFEFDPQMQIPIGTVITVDVNVPYLIKSIVTTVVSVGEIYIKSAPSDIAFGLPAVSPNPALLRRHEPVEAVVIEDTRPYPEAWKLSASITGPLKTADGMVLENAVVFKDDDDILRDLGDTPLVVRTGGPATGETEVSWTYDKGILVRATQPIRSGALYYTNLVWTLEADDEP